MLNMLRKKAQSTLIQAVVLIIAIVFIFWGVGANLGSKRSAMATVNGEEIPYQNFQRSYDSAVENLRIQFGGSIPQGFLEGLGLDRQVLNQLVQAEIMRQGGQKMGIAVSKIATQDEIMNMEVFRTNGQFDLQRYQDILGQNRMTPTAFEASLQDDLLTRQVTDAIRGFAVVTDSQVQSRFAHNNEEIKLAYVAVKSEDQLALVQAEDEALAAWFAEHKQDFLTDPKIRLQYLFFSYDDDLREITISDDTLRARYEAGKDQYFTPEQRRARHILLRVNENDDVQVRADKKVKAEEVLKLAREGKDFAELAKEYSEGPTAANGGDLGFFSKGAMVESFDQAVFAMETGAISEVVETVFGYHVIKLEEIRPATTRTFDEVKDEIAAQAKQQEVKGVTFKRATQAYEDIIRSGSLEKYRTTHDQNIEQTDYFSQENPPGPPVSDPRFLQAAFRLNKGELSSLTETGKGYAILFVDDIQAPEVPELDAVREEVTEGYRKARSLELAKEKAEMLLKEARDKKGLASAVNSEFEIKESGYIRLSDQSGSEDVPAQVVQKASSLSAKDTLPDQIVAMGDTFYVFELLERKQGDQQLDDAKQQELREQLQVAVQNELMQGWLAWMQDKAEVWVNDQFFQ